MLKRTTPLAAIATSSIIIENFFLEDCTEWELWQKLCDLAQLYVYQRNDGKIVTISQKKINEIKLTKASNPIIIPYTLINGTPTKERLNNNKITKVEIVENVVTKEISEIMNYTFAFVDNGVTTELLNPPVDAELVESTVSGLLNLRFVCEIPSNENTYFFRNISGIGSYRITEYKDRITNETTSISNPIGTLNIYKEEVDFDDVSTSVGIYKILKSSSHKKWVLACNTSIDPQTQYSKQLIAKCDKLFIQKNELVFGSGNNVYKLPSNEFMNNTTTIDGVSICEYNATQILNNFTGKQTISFNCAIDTLKNKNGNTVYEYRNGEILQEFDLIQLKRTDGTLEPEIWQVTKVEIDASGGRNFINVEGVQI